MKTLRPADAKKQIAALRSEIECHNQLYYIEAAPEITDREFDERLRQLVALETQFPQFFDPHSPTQRVGGEPLKEFENRPHARPMMSLENRFTREEIDAYAQKHRGPFVVEPKIDGISICVRYEKGRFVHALTRGDGARGDDVSANLKTIPTLPLQLRTDHPPAVFEARGEVYMTRSGFSQLNEQRQDAGLSAFANPRNACAGSMKLLDPREVAQRPLDVIFYATGELVGIELATHRELIDQLHRFGLKTAAFEARCDTPAELWAAIEQLDGMRERFEYEIDGAVIKIDDRTRYAELGGTSKFPHWATAYKYPPEQAETTLKSITLQIGRTGVLTPVAELEPVALAGTIVKRATLHNDDEIQRKDLRIGDRVIVEKAGEIIPAVVRACTEQRSGSERPFDMRSACEKLGIEAIQRPGEVAWRIDDLHHPAMLKRWLTHYASRNAMDIDGLGESIVELLVDCNLVRDPADLYEINQDQLLQLEGFQSKKAINLLRGIEASKQRPFDRILFALGIRHVGAGAARLLAREFSTIEELIDADAQRLETIRDIGPVVGKSIVDFFQCTPNRTLIERLQACGVHFEREEEAAEHPDFAGLSFVLTGTLKSMSRQAAGDEIRKRGGTVASSVSKKTDFLVAGAKAGSKRTKAEALGVSILDEDALLARLGAPSESARAPESDQLDLF